VEITRQQLIDVGIPPEDVDDVKPMRGQGCKTCNNTGYKGRIAVYEIMIANDEVKEFILNGASTLELKREAVRQGMKTLRMSAISKFREGQTSLEEIVRTTAPD
jgi:type IV pilus assembly protein PilB